MELHQLEYFLAVAEERNFTRGAERVRIAQSAVSAAIRKLERELGVELFDRGGSQIALTRAGMVLVPEARAALAAVRSVREAMDQVAGGLRGTLTIGTTLAPGPLDLPGALGRFHLAHPEVVIRMKHSAQGSAGNLRAVADGGLDLALVAFPGSVPAGVRLRPLASEPLVLICPPGHRLAECDHVALAELIDETFIDFPLGWGARAVVDYAFATAGCTRRVGFEVTDHRMAAGLIRQELGLAFMPASAAAELAPLPAATLDDPGFTWVVSAATAAGPTQPAAVTALLAELALDPD